MLSRGVRDLQGKLGSQGFYKVSRGDRYSMQYLGESGIYAVFREVKDSM